VVGEDLAEAEAGFIGLGLQLGGAGDLDLHGSSSNGGETVAARPFASVMKMIFVLRN
jgi:hypothetical protein